jgi:hypothetical protein
VPPFVADAATLARWTFPDHALLAGMLQALPAATRKVLVFVPYHQFHQPPPGAPRAAEFAECKRRVAAMAAAVPNAYVLDSMIPSPLTTRDENYWDGLHYRVETGTQLIALIGEAVSQHREVAGYLRYLAGPDGAARAGVENGTANDGM